MEKSKPPVVLIAVLIVGLVGLVCAVPAVLGIAGWFYMSQPAEVEYFEQPSEVENVEKVETSANPGEAVVSGPVMLDGSEPKLGGARVEIEVVQFSDFQCPYCSSRFEELVALTNNRVWLRLQFKHYPLSNTCNPNISRDMHEYACDAAKAADCANEQGLFWEMAAAMFADQEALAEDQLMQTAQSIGLQMSPFRRCMEKGYTSGLESDIASGKASNITGTPSIYAHVIRTDEWYKVTGDLAMSLQELRK